MLFLSTTKNSGIEVRVIGMINQRIIDLKGSQSMFLNIWKLILIVPQKSIRIPVSILIVYLPLFKIKVASLTY